MQSVVKAFEELSNKELYDILRLRAEIFVVEQDCVYNDLDNNDQLANHLMMKSAEGEVLGYVRLLNRGTRFRQASIGRLVVAKEQRFKGLARQLMTEAALWMKDNWQVKTIHISAQKYLKAFYASLGYEIVTDEYLEDGIPHLGMDLLV